MMHCAWFDPAELKERFNSERLFHDVAQLLKVLHQLRDAGNTVVVIEHNLGVIKTADWVIDMGPEGGAGGGTVAASYTGRYLGKML